MTLPPTPTSTPAPRGLWSRMKAHILHPELSPEQVAWSFAIGFSIAWNPLLGLHTALVFLICVLFRHLHRPLMILAMLINNPWTLVPIATANTWVGDLLRGQAGASNPAKIPWGQITWHSFVSLQGLRDALMLLHPILASYLLGGLLTTVLALPLGYFFMKWLTLRLRRAHWPHLHHPAPPSGD